MPVTTATHRKQILCILNDALKIARSKTKIDLPTDVSGWIKSFSEKINKQTTSAFTNILTCLIAKAVDANCDPRFHRPPKKGMPPAPKGGTYHTGRTISEKAVYPWLAENQFRGAKSGWQTRVFERKQPYDLKFTENISGVKTEFLEILNVVANNKVKAVDVISQFLRYEVVERNARIAANNRVSKFVSTHEVSIAEIVGAIKEHFKTKMSARLPVLAIYATYQVIMPFLARYREKKLLPLSEHAAADTNTGASGDIEIVDSDNDVFEALEIKYNLAIDNVMIRTACDKIRTTGASRYYILSTNDKPIVTDVGLTLIEELRREHRCQLILNGVIPAIKYYLRLVDKPADFIRAYGHLLATDRISRDLIESWAAIISKLK